MLNRNILLSLVLLLTSCSDSPEMQYLSIRVDGIYRAKDMDTKLGTAYLYLRFYSDGNVKSATLIGTPEQFWMATLRNTKYESEGKYSLHGDKITFDARSENVVVQYIGVVKNKERMTLQSYSLSSGHKTIHDYNFVKINEEKLPAWTRFSTVRPRQDGGVELKEVPNK